jgi:hypothetical protein
VAGAPPATNGAHAAAPVLPPPRRRRRSASLLDPHPSPVDIPEDAEGRVVFHVPSVPPDVLPIAPVATSLGAGAAGWADTELAGAPPLSARTPLGEVNPWISVALVGVALLAVFVLGLLVTR